ncbi:hypothetical protein B0J13DRAFT_254113 [Dactylonectria estremocensis]|uniref:DUF7779 domain-containing protein n=1 Tax=Dactylonectria estremocensis TaxID=1079267 RepID=A0A9P9JCE6_9HYPO|nr:hypothetical protein B0J13DRAFT_254113 [Dactylonectria estremocensis]
MNRLINSDELSGVNKLLDELDRLPLAIYQAGAYMRKASTPVAEYSSMLNEGKERWRMLKDTEFDTHRRSDAPNSVLETWNILIRRIKKGNDMSYKILHTISYLDNQSIPLEILMAAATNSHSSSEKRPRRSEREVRTAIRRLEEFSFITAQQTELGKKTFEMHKLVQEASRYGLHIQDRQQKNSWKSRWRFRGLKITQGEDEAPFSSVAREIMT